MGGREIYTEEACFASPSSLPQWLPRLPSLRPPRPSEPAACLLSRPRARSRCAVALSRWYAIPTPWNSSQTSMHPCCQFEVPTARLLTGSRILSINERLDHPRDAGFYIYLTTWLCGDRRRSRPTCPLTPSPGSGDASGRPTRTRTHLSRLRTSWLASSPRCDTHSVLGQRETSSTSRLHAFQPVLWSLCGLSSDDLHVRMCVCLIMA